MKMFNRTWDDAPGIDYYRRMRLFDWAPLSIWLHKFTRTDANPKPHDHHFWFVTFPFHQGYWEEIYEQGKDGFELRYVRPFWFHFRSKSHSHRIVQPARSWPIYTLCLIGPRPCTACARISQWLVTRLERLNVG